MHLSQFQDTLAHALLPPTRPVPAAPQWLIALQAQPGFAVYRNTVARGCIDALQANYPTLVQLLGTDCFTALAQAYLHQHPPQDGRLMAYGEGLAAFLAQWPGTQELPYLPAIAAWDRRWTECHLAADAQPLTAQDLAHHLATPEVPLHIHPHPATRWGGDNTHPAFTLWRWHREGAPTDQDLAWEGDAGLLTRAEGAVQWTPLPPCGVALLDALAAGATLDEASHAAWQCQPGARQPGARLPGARLPETDLPGLWATLLQTGALTAAPAPDSAPIAPEET